MTAASYAEQVITTATQMARVYEEKAANADGSWGREYWSALASHQHALIGHTRTLAALAASERHALLNFAHTLDRLARRHDREAEKWREIGEWNAEALDSGTATGLVIAAGAIREAGL